MTNFQSLRRTLKQNPMNNSPSPNMLLPLPKVSLPQQLKHQ